MRFTEMRLMEWVGGAVAIAGFAMSTSTAIAQSCNYTNDSGCVVVDDVYITGSSGSGGWAGGGSYNPTQVDNLRLAEVLLRRPEQLMT